MGIVGACCGFSLLSSYRLKECSSGFSAGDCGIGIVDSLVEWVRDIGMGKGGGV